MRMVRHNGAISLKSPDSYLFRTARNLATDMLRTWAVRSKYTEAADIEAQPSTAPLQDAALDTSQRQKLVQKAMQELSTRCSERRTIFKDNTDRNRFLEGLAGVSGCDKFSGRAVQKV